MERTLKEIYIGSSQLNKLNKINLITSNFMKTIQTFMIQYLR
jgi:hypothetical protein